MTPPPNGTPSTTLHSVGRHIFQISKLLLKFYYCDDEHIMKDCLKPEKIKKDMPQHPDQPIYMTFSTNAYTPLEMLQDINKWIKALKFKKNRKYSNML